jgi:hypothetical protein
MQHLLGSRARYPHSSSRSNPLQVGSVERSAHGLNRHKRLNRPHTEHIDEVLLSNVVFPIHIALERGEDTLPTEEMAPTLLFQGDQVLGRDTVGIGVWDRGIRLGRDRKVLELLAQNDNGLFVKERVRSRRRRKLLRAAPRMSIKVGPRLVKEL